MDIDLMSVEERVGVNHGLRGPTAADDPRFAGMLGEVVVLVEECGSIGFSPKVREILARYAGRPLDFSLLESTRFSSWKACVDFVRDDDCIHAALIAHSHVRKVWEVAPKVDRDFIDGEGGIGFYVRLLDRMKRAAEKAFDCKWHFKARRPLQYLRDVIGLQAALRCVSYPHPAHWSYPAGHGAKFAASFDAFVDLYDLSSFQEAQLFSFFFVLSSARSGGGVHFMEDNCASWSLVAGRAVGGYVAVESGAV